MMDNAVRIAGTERVGKSAYVSVEQKTRTTSRVIRGLLTAPLSHGHGRFLEYGRPNTSTNASVASSARTIASRRSPDRMSFVYSR
jgi:hypothetical protein